ncbi:MAG: four helix bundle protein [Rhodothermales bacterium]|nr:four helix bundle protein [Rhodothermales bacterium]
MNNLHTRFFEFAVALANCVEQMPGTYLGRHIAHQLIRSGTAPLANYAEAGAAESRRDFIHKMGICLKELRESVTWLQLAERLALGNPEALAAVRDEAQQLTRITAQCILTARKRLNNNPP